MTVEIWYGRWPETEGEQDALLEVYRFLQSQDQHFILMVQLHAGESNEIDWVIAKSNGIFIVELKYARDRLVGSSEGNWRIECPDDSVIDLRSNPLKQVKHAYWRFTEWCRDNQDAISQGIDRPWPANYKQGSRSYIVITPDLHPESQVEVPMPIEIVGLNKFLLMLLMRSSPRLELSMEELQRLPVLLKLKKWEAVVPAAKTSTAETRRINPDWNPAPFTGLVSLGHNASTPMLDLEKLGKTVITVGRGPDNDLVIEDETVSRHHARLVRQGDWYAVEDLTSTAGTFVNFKGEPEMPDRRLEAGQINGLRNHSIVRFGQVRFIFLCRQ